MGEKKKLYQYDYEEQNLFSVFFNAAYPIQCYFEGLSQSNLQPERNASAVGLALIRDLYKNFESITESLEEHLGEINFHIYKNEQEEAAGLVEVYNYPYILGVVLTEKEKAAQE